MPGEVNEHEQVDVGYYANVLRKHRLPIGLATLTAIVLAVGYVQTATPLYRATSTLLIEPQKANVVSIEDLIGADTQAKDDYATQFALLGSRNLAKKVINALGLWDRAELVAKESVFPGKPFATLERWADTFAKGANGGDATVREDGATTPSGEPPADASDEVETRGRAKRNRREAIVSRYLARLSVTPIDNTKLVTISFESTDPELAADVANMVGEQYITNYLDTRLQRTAKATSWLGLRVAELKSTLDESERRLLAFKEENDLTDVEGRVSRLDEQQVIAASDELGRARAQLADAQNLYRQTQALGDDSVLLLTLPVIQADVLVQQTRAAQGEARLELDELSNRYGERHPRVIDAKSRLASIGLELAERLRRAVGAIERDYGLARERVSGVEAKLEAGKQGIQFLGASEFKLDALRREVDANRGIYETFFNRMSEARSADGLESANATVSDRAVPAGDPFRPRKLLIVSLAAATAFAVAAFVAILRNRLDGSLVSTREVTTRLGLPLIGVLPRVKTARFRTGRRKTSPLGLVSGPAFVEAINAVRTALVLKNGDERSRQVIVVTSSVPGEGKSTLSLNLAHAFGQLERTLLIEGDMRRPALARALGRSRHSPGLGGLIAGTAVARQCVSRGSSAVAADVLLAGPRPEHPLELLSSERFAMILKDLRTHYDRIIIDSAPVQSVSDALVLGKLADAILYVVKPRDTPLGLVVRCLQRAWDADLPVAGAVLTQVQARQLDSYAGEDRYDAYYDEAPRSGRSSDARMRLSAEQLKRIKTDGRPVRLDLDAGSSRAANTRGPGHPDSLDGRCADAGRVGRRS